MSTTLKLNKKWVFVNIRFPKWVLSGRKRGFWRILTHFRTQNPTLDPLLDPFQPIDKNPS